MRAKYAIVLPAVVLLAILMLTEPVQADWLSGWTHRRPVTIANSCEGGLTDYPVWVLLDSSFDFSGLSPTEAICALPRMMAQRSSRFGSRNGIPAVKSPVYGSTYRPYRRLRTPSTSTMEIPRRRLPPMEMRLSMYTTDSKTGRRIRANGRVTRATR